MEVLGYTRLHREPHPKPEHSSVESFYKQLFLHSRIAEVESDVKIFAFEPSEVYLHCHV